MASASWWLVLGHHGALRSYSRIADVDPWRPISISQQRSKGPTNSNPGVNLDARQCVTSHAFTVGYSDRDQNAATGYGHTETTSATPLLPGTATSNFKHMDGLAFLAWSTLLTRVRCFGCCYRSRRVAQLLLIRVRQRFRSNWQARKMHCCTDPAPDHTRRRT